MGKRDRLQRLLEEVRNEIREITNAEALRYAREKKAVFVDVRETYEWFRGHVPGALHIPRGLLEQQIEKRLPDPSTCIICYSGTGLRSALAAWSLQKMGYSHVFSLAGGWQAWRKAGLPSSTEPEQYPRSPFAKLGGIVYLPRLIDKARFCPQGKLPGYEYLTSGFDKMLLDFLCIEGRRFEEIVQQYETDEEILAQLRKELGPAWPSEYAIAEFNQRMIHKRPETPEKRAKFEAACSKLPPGRKRPDTYFELMDAQEGRPPA